MPGHFTHIYTARRVADLLENAKFNDWPHATDAGVNALRNYDPSFCGTIMKRWEKFTAIGAVGPDLFYYSQDYNSDTIGPNSDRIMLALATYYYFDAAMEDDWEPLLVILDGINSEIAAILRILIKLQKAWNDFVAGWNATIGPVVDAVGELADDLLGGLLSQFQVVLEELKLALVNIGEEELVTFKDIWSFFDTCVEKGWQEASFLWSDMSHYRRTTAMAEALVEQAEALKDGEDGQNRYEQFLAFALGYITHLGTDTVAHSWVNTQVGGPFRNHPQRHHLVECHVDSWNYKNAGFDPDPMSVPCPNDVWAGTPDYPDMSTSALWFAVQITPDDPHGKQRPSPVPEDPDARKAALDVDGEMPLWMAESIVRAMMAAFPDENRRPKIYRGSTFQQAIDEGLITEMVRTVTGNEVDRPIDELLAGIAPPPPFNVPQGFPLPWEIQTMYRVMISQYKLSYNGNWELQKPKRPDPIIFPPASDFTDPFQPPDFSGVDSSDPLIDVCEAIIALFEWAAKELGDAIKLAGDIIKMLASPFTYAIRLALWELAMHVWDVVMKTHDLLAHTGFFFPHGQQLYPDGELRLPNEIDVPLITMGGSVDGSFKQALADAIDPLGNLDKDLTVIASDHPVPDERYPFYPVLRFELDQSGELTRPPEGWEYRRPWAYPNVSLFTPAGSANIPITTPTESYDPSKSDPNAPSIAFKPLRGGPYAAGTRPDHVYFRIGVPVDPKVRAAYENARTPYQTDMLNEAHLTKRLGISPLGDPVPFSAYLIGRIANATNYRTQFNLDSDRGYGYLTWDWIRTDVSEHERGGMFSYSPPVVEPSGDVRWIPATSSLSAVGAAPLELTYVDLPFRRIPPRPVNNLKSEAGNRPASKKSASKKSGKKAQK
jgi:hypothetical protein